MDHADPPIPIWQARIMWAEADCPFLRRDRLIDRAGEKFALAEGGDGGHPVAIERDRPFVFWYGRLELALRTQQLASDKVPNWIPWRGLQYVGSQRLCALEIGRGGIGHLVKHAGGQRLRQQSPRSDRAGIERQRRLAQANCLV